MLSGFARELASLFLLLVWSSTTWVVASEWNELIGQHGLDLWRKPTGSWVVAGDAVLKPDNQRLLAAKPGAGVLVNGPTGKTDNLLSKENHGAIETHFEFLVPMGSNSGVKFEGLYEIQIADSFGKKQATASDCGGIYPRADLTPNYHHIDKGIPPKANAAKPAGQWQSLDVIFLPPQFDKSGKKIANARFVKVVLNDQLIHENQDLQYPTGHAWRLKEISTGPILLQADHGPVAFRNIRVRNWPPNK